MERDWLAAQLEAGRSYEAIAREAGCSASKVAYWASKHGLTSAHTTRHAAKGPIDEDLLRALVASHFSIREIAETMERSAASIRHWLAKLGLETHPTRHSPAAARAAAAGIDEPRRRSASPWPSVATPARSPQRALRRASASCCARTATLKSKAASPMFP
jgi:hypothetical protein